MRQVVANIIDLPRVINSTDDISAYDALKRSGYFEQHDAVSERDLYDALREHPDRIDDWMQYAEDKRTDRGWYFTTDTSVVPCRIVVGYFSRRTKVIEQEYADRIEAAATYVKMEIENIRTKGRSSSYLTQAD